MDRAASPFLRRALASHNQLPDQIDRAVLSNLSGSVQSSMIKTLEALALIDAAGKPTKALRDLLSHQRGYRRWTPGCIWRRRVSMDWTKVRGAEAARGPSGQPR